MTRKVRKRFLIGATTTAQIIVLVHIALILFLFVFSEGLGSFASIPEMIPQGKPFLLVIALSLQAAVSGGALLGLFLFFRKTPSPEVFFFQFALLGFAFSSLRLLAIPLSYYITSLFTLMPLTKFVFFGRLFAVLCLFLSGLFSTGLTFQKQGVYLSTAFMLAVVIAATLPVDCTRFTLPLICDAGSTTGFNLAFNILSLFSVLNYVYAAGLHSDRNYTYNAIALLLVIGGMQLSYFFAHAWIGLIGLLLVILGTFIFAHRTHTIYLWF